MTQDTDHQTTQYEYEWENQYNACYETPENIENMDSKDHVYTEIDYFTCKPKINETQIRNSRVYDVPYVETTMDK